MNNVSPQDIAGFLAACHDAAGRGLMKCSSGNMSKRLDDERLIASASRSWMERIREKEVSLCRICDGQLIDGPKQTVEIAFHAEILRRRPEMNVVLHFQSPCATTLACSGDPDINYFVIPEIPFYMGQIGHVPYLAPGSPELATAVTEVMTTHDMAIMDHHGLVTAAKDYDHAIQNAVFFELACEVIVRSQRNATPLRESDAQVMIEAHESC